MPETPSVEQALATWERTHGDHGCKCDACMYIRALTLQHEADERDLLEGSRIASEATERAEKAEAQHEADAERIAGLEKAINWVCGCGDSDFGMDLPEDAPRYWWRKVLAEKAGLAYDRDLARYAAHGAGK